MAAQAALIADTIVGMKRALRRETHGMFFVSHYRDGPLLTPTPDSAPDDSITQPTNRGNKLRTNARFVREGALGYIHPEDFYKQVNVPLLSMLSSVTLTSNSIC